MDALRTHPAALVPGVLGGCYPEARPPHARSGRHERHKLRRRFSPALARSSAAQRRFLAAVRAVTPDISLLAERDWPARLAELRVRLATAGGAEASLIAAMAWSCVAAARTLGVTAHDGQVLAARVMLGGDLAEMATGEGKTLAGAMTAAVAALGGVPVHVVTANDYLVGRDTRWLTPFYAALGLTVASVSPADVTPARCAAYRRDVVYTTARELIFDYLRDHLDHPRRQDLSLRAAALTAHSPASTRLRGLSMAIVDEADSVLIDEASVPFLLSRKGSLPEDDTFYRQALGFAHGLAAGHDYLLSGNPARAELTAAGRERVRASAAPAGPQWRQPRLAQHTVELALTALHALEPAHDYLVREGRVQMVDAVSGRTQPDRTWSRGLQQLLELKEGCAPTVATVPVAQLSYQQFFPRYLRLAGMSGTLLEARAELRAAYDLDVVRVPLHAPDRRKLLPTRAYANRHALWSAVCERARELTAQGRPVLIGTDSIADSEDLAATLRVAGLSLQVLNARQDVDEATAIARAGHAASITVATNMAGRGTDIVLGAGVAERGGLHVIACQHNGARRIDRQIIGRCARQGDPGSAETWLAVDSPRLPRPLSLVWRRRKHGGAFIPPSWLLDLAWRLVQRAREREARLQRAWLASQHQRLYRGLSFGGPCE